MGSGPIALAWSARNLIVNTNVDPPPAIINQYHNNQPSPYTRFKYLSLDRVLNNVTHNTFHTKFQLYNSPFILNPSHPNDSSDLTTGFLWGPAGTILVEYNSLGQLTIYKMVCANKLVYIDRKYLNSCILSIKWLEFQPLWRFRDGKISKLPSIGPQPVYGEISFITVTKEGNLCVFYQTGSNVKVKCYPINFIGNKDGVYLSKAQLEFGPNGRFYIIAQVQTENGSSIQIFSFIMSPITTNNGLDIQFQQLYAAFLKLPLDPSYSHLIRTLATATKLVISICSTCNQQGNSTNGIFNSVISQFELEYSKLLQSTPGFDSLDPTNTVKLDGGVAFMEHLPHSGDILLGYTNGIVEVRKLTIIATTIGKSTISFLYDVANPKSDDGVQLIPNILGEESMTSPSSHPLGHVISATFSPNGSLCIFTTSKGQLIMTNLVSWLGDMFSHPTPNKSQLDLVPHLLIALLYNRDVLDVTSAVVAYPLPCRVGAVSYARYPVLQSVLMDILHKLDGLFTANMPTMVPSPRSPTFRRFLALQVAMFRYAGGSSPRHTTTLMILSKVAAGFDVLDTHHHMEGDVNTFDLEKLSLLAPVAMFIYYVILILFKDLYLYFQSHEEPAFSHCSILAHPVARKMLNESFSLAYRFDKYVSDVNAHITDLTPYQKQWISYWVESKSRLPSDFTKMAQVIIGIRKALDAAHITFKEKIKAQEDIKVKEEPNVKEEIKRKDDVFLFEGNVLPVVMPEWAHVKVIGVKTLVYSQLATTLPILHRYGTNWLGLGIGSTIDSVMIHTFKSRQALFTSFSASPEPKDNFIDQLLRSQPYRTRKPALSESAVKKINEVEKQLDAELMDQINLLVKRITRYPSRYRRKALSHRVKHISAKLRPSHINDVTIPFNSASMAQLVQNRAQLALFPPKPTDPLTSLEQKKETPNLNPLSSKLFTANKNGLFPMLANGTFENSLGTLLGSPASWSLNLGNVLDTQNMAVDESPPFPDPLIKAKLDIFQLNSTATINPTPEFDSQFTERVCLRCQHQAHDSSQLTRYAQPLQPNQNFPPTFPTPLCPCGGMWSASS